jgi:NifU-like protein involved in Fe-S cluster formation
MKPSQNVFGYPEPIWRRFRAPVHAGRIEPGARHFDVQAGSPAARSLLRLQLAIAEDGRRHARFLAYGCPSAIAVGEWLASEIERLPPSAWPAISAADIREVLEIPEDRAHCALMGEDALRALSQAVASHATS